MERLTQKSINYCAEICRAQDCETYHGVRDDVCGDAAIYNRLAAYEDTGLSPEEIKELCTDEVAEIARMFRKMIHSGEIDHLIDLMKAEQEGRLVVLPCKVGDFLYEIDLPEYGVIKCKALSVDYYNGPLAHVPNNEMVELWSAGVEVVEGHGTGSCYAFEQTDFGKTVFLSREEAEKALKGDGKDE